MGSSYNLDQPIFQEVPENLNETWDWGVLVGGMGDERDTAAIARAYKLAGDTLVSRALEGKQAYEIAYPIFFVYRHALELYLKAIVQPRRLNHAIDALINPFEQHCLEVLHQQVPPWVGQRLREFADSDPRAVAFRYVPKGDEHPEARFEETWVDLRHLRLVLEALCRGFERVLHQTAGLRWHA